MLVRHWRTRPRPRPRRLTRHRAGLWTENLEARRLLVAPPINVAAGLTIASGLPLPGLATGYGLVTTAQTLPSSTASVAPSSVEAPFAATPTGPSTTLSPLMNDSETANATASEVARPTPGRSDRISVILEAPEVVVIPHLVAPGAIVVIPGPELLAPPVPVIEPVPTIELVPPQQAPEPAAPPIATPIRQDSPVSSESLSLQVWDAALELLARDLAGTETSTSLATQTEGALAAGVMLAAWTGWKYGPRSQGRSRRQALAMTVAERTADDSFVL